MAPCRRTWTWASMRPGRSVESPRSMTLASPGTAPPTDSILLPRTPTTPGRAGLPRVRVECAFRIPVTLDELLLVEAWFGKIGTTSIHIDFEVRRKGARDAI